MNLQDWETYKEINQQPDIWRTWADDFGAKLDAIREWVAAQDADEIWLCGAGTSAYIGDLIAAHMGADVRRIRAISTTDLVSCPQNFIRSGLNPLVISLGRSGNSTETIGTLDLLDALLPNAPRLNITCNAESVLATRGSSAAQKVIILPEKCHDAGFAMTSSYTTMLLTALLILDETTGPDDLRQLANAAETLLPAYFKRAAEQPQPGRVVFTGSGALAFAARESALKVMELAAGDIPSIWDSCLGFRHGPKSFVNSKTQVFIFLSNHAFTSQYDRDLAAEVRDQFGPNSVTTIGISNADVLIPKQHNDAIASVLYVLLAQVLATVWSHNMGLNVDNPFDGRGTLTRVVSGVKLYAPDDLI
ncbi:MAG: SIS domain-containing protein [Rhodobacteraceae bacterium]|nr:SIS domain-containing protein [Paracoccaceae bacterium]